jgi:hypothetical protein
LPIYDDTLAGWIGFLAQAGDLTVDLHATLTDHLFAGTPGTDPSMGHHFL